MAAEQQQRQLAVILHADIDGSTALVRRDETLAHELITDAFIRFSRTIERYGGRVHEVRGDALVAEFARASDAVCAALAFQQSHTTHRTTLSDEIGPAIRIGISLGEVVFADDTVTGAGVVLAQRVEQLAEPDGVCITAAIHEAVPDRMPFDQESLGEQEVKGFDEPVRVYSVRTRDGAELPEPIAIPARRKTQTARWVTAAAAVILVASGGILAWWQPWQPREEPPSEKRTEFLPQDKPSIAVLPFENMSDDKEQEYFSDGLTEDIITDLARISGLRVIARQSSFSYKGATASVVDVGRELGVRYILEGSVRRSHDRIRINAKLVDAKDGANIWANRYDHTLKDVFELQDKVTESIVSALAVSLTSDEERFLQQTKIVDPDAYDLLLRGLEPLQRFTGEGNVLARGYFERAIHVDPDYARAHANLALTYARDVVFSWTEERETAIRKALASADRAESLDDTLTQTHFSRSVVYLAQMQHQAAAASSRKAVEIDPNYADGYGMLAQVLVQSGELDEALEAIRMAKYLNPRYPFAYQGIEGHIYLLSGQYEQAVPVLRAALERNPAFTAARLNLIASLGQLGLKDDAEWELDELLTVRPNYGLSIARREVLYKRQQDKERFIEGLAKAGLAE